MGWRVLIAMLSCALGLLSPPALADAAPQIGIVIMHGKGSSPARFVAPLANALEARGLLVANIEMPWSGRRNYDAAVGAAEQEVAAALTALRNRGAHKLFVAGHSQGGLFALYFGNAHAPDGVIAIAPGGNVANRMFRQNVGESVDLARRLVAEGTGEEKARLTDWEGSRGIAPVATTPAVYLSWFDPEGAMNQTKAVQGLNPAIPVLFIVPTGDYPALRDVKQQMFNALPKNPLTRLYEPEASHVNAPAASVDAITEWTARVAGQRAP